jgi:flagellar motor protein MotB
MKLTITESQLELIITHIQETEIKKEVLEEGWKEVVLGTAMLLGIGLSGANAQTANNALDNAQILKQIENTLESNKVQKLAQTLEKAGMQNAMDKIEKNAAKLEANFNKAAAKKGLDLKLRMADASDTQDIEDKLRQGYAVQDIKITKDTILPEGTTVLVQDTIDVNYSSDAMFVTAGFELTPQTVDDIKSTIKDIDTTGGKIVKVMIESSTDKEPIKMGNEKLAQLRANEVQKLLVDAGVEGNIETVTKPDSGPDLYSRTMSKEQRQEARKETAKYRYTNVKIIVIIPVDAPGDETAPQIVEKLEVQLVKAKIPADGSTHKGKHKKTRGKIKCKVIKFKKGGSTKCPTW